MGTAQTNKTPEELRTRLHDIVARAHTVVLLDHSPDGRIVGRPMANVKTDDATRVHLVTSMDSKKIAELHANPRVALSIQDREGHAMIDGEAHVSQDRALIDELWQDSWKVWFNGGKADPNIAIVIVEPLEGTYWDGDFTHGLSYLWRMIKARLTDAPFQARPGDQESVDLRRH